MSTRRNALAVWALLSFLPLAHADEFSNNFQSHLNVAALDALAKDLGTLVGGGSFHTGDTLNFPVGFDVGFHLAGAELDSSNPILRDDDSYASIGWAQAEVGLPFDLGVMARAGKLHGADVIGGGLRWGVWDSSLPAMPSIAVSALYHALDHDFVEAETFSGNVVLSFDVPIIHPYVGAGYDRTTADPTSRAFSAAAPGTDTSIEGDASGYRVEAGINLSIIPFTYITLGGGLANGGAIGHVGAGIRF